MSLPSGAHHFLHVFVITRISEFIPQTEHQFLPYCEELTQISVIASN